MVEIVGEWQVNVGHQKFFRANDNFSWGIFFIMKPEGAEGVVGEETISNLNPAPANADLNYLRFAPRVEHQGEGAKQDEQSEEKILRYDRCDHKREGDKANQPIPIARSLARFILKRFPFDDHGLIIAQGNIQGNLNLDKETAPMCKHQSGG